MKVENKRSYYSAMIEEVSPLLMYMAPIKQRAVLEVLVRKSIGMKIDFTDREYVDDGSIDVKVSFEFDVGLPVLMAFSMDVQSMKQVRGLIFTSVMSHSYTQLNDSTPTPVGALLTEPMCYEDCLATVEIMTCPTLGNVLGISSFSDETATEVKHTRRFDDMVYLAHLTDEIMEGVMG